MKSVLLIALLAFSTQLYAQDAIPAGTILPVRLESSLSKKSTPGHVVKARIMQDVPLANGSRIPAGATVFGQVVNVASNGTNPDTQITLKFDRVVSSNHTIPVTTDLRAVASIAEVDEAQVPDMGPDRGTPPSAYTTVQVGGNEVVYRGGGNVMDASQVVGEPVPDGVLGRVRPNLLRGCRGEIDDKEPSQQALWVFASDACGVYGYANLKIVNSGRDNPLGEIVIAAEQGDVNVAGGSGMLLRVMNNQPAVQVSGRS
ncbi:MAG: hypothetical protein WCA15_02200 [Candidatus Acidiferrales bacterium]